MHPIIELLRPHQLYKNVVVFLAIFFSGSLFNLNLFLNTLVAFVSLSLVSSGMYALNDVVDAERDKRHPRKRNRPIPSGRVSKSSAVVLGSVLVLVGLYLALQINLLTFVAVLALFLNTILYSLFLKKIPFLDIADLSVNFLLRTLAGVYAIGVSPSYWIIVIPYFLALYLALLKRYGEVKRGSRSREVVRLYDESTLSLLAVGTLFTLLVLYSLYLQSAPHLHHKTLVTLLTLPLAVFVLFRWYKEAVTNPDVAEEPFRMVRDTVFVVGILFWAVVLTLAIYVL